MIRLRSCLAPCVALLFGFAHLGSTFAAEQGKTTIVAKQAATYTAYGAARTVSGSMHYLQANGKNILIDAGSRQGKDAERERIFTKEMIGADALVITHSHTDHTGEIAKLVKAGFRGKIYMTPVTAEITHEMMLDGVKIAKNRAKDKQRAGDRFAVPDFTLEDVENVMKLVVSNPVDQPFTVAGIPTQFYRAGHIPGAASVHFDIKEGDEQKRIVFSGDIGRGKSSILKAPTVPQGATHVVMESTNGNKQAPAISVATEALGSTILKAAAKGGNVYIPAFSLGRTQDILFRLAQLSAEGKLNVPVYLDSPLASKLTAIIERHPEEFNDEVRAFMAKHPGSPFRFPQLHVIEDWQEGKDLMDGAPGTKKGIIIAGSGMLAGGKILGHLQKGLTDAKNTLIFVGYQGEGTVGREIQDGAKQVSWKDYKRNTVQVEVKASIERVSGFSGHADIDDLMVWAKAVKTQGKGKNGPKMYLVHGDEPSMENFEKNLTTAGFNVHIPSEGEANTLSR